MGTAVLSKPARVIARAMPVDLSDRVCRGQTLATVESNDSMCGYMVTRRWTGGVLARNHSQPLSMASPPIAKAPSISPG